MSSAAPSDKDGKGPSWWDREVDYRGRPNRADVRMAGHEVWGQACARLQAILGDASDAPELMEKSVSVISRYLDRIGSPQFAESRNGLLMKAFSSALRRYAMKLGRIELVEDLSVFSERHLGPSCATKEDCRLDAEKAARHLSRRGRMMLELRRDGFDWQEIAEVLKTTNGAARAEYSRELKRARVKLQAASNLGKVPGSECP